jgi:predicted 2-oxoglutarate/Fe(II)-dependent dioxygenase YbiX
MLIEKNNKIPCLWIYKESIDVGNIVELIEEQTRREWAYVDWNHSITGDGNYSQQSEYRNSLELDLNILLADTINPDVKELHDNLIKKIMTPLDECVWDYRNAWDLHLKEDSGYYLLKYEDNAEYHIHQDHSPENQRVLSLVACLSDGFAGGELEFPYFETTIKLEKNSIAFFPSNFPYSHIAHPVTQGTKYSMVTWFK